MDPQAKPPSAVRSISSLFIYFHHDPIYNCDLKRVMLSISPFYFTYTTGIEADTSLTDFLALVAEKTGVNVSSLEILTGFPPKPLDIQNNSAATVGALGIQSGDNVTVRQLAGSDVAVAGDAAAAATGPAVVGSSHFDSQELTSPGGGGGGGGRGSVGGRR